MCSDFHVSMHQCCVVPVLVSILMVWEQGLDQDFEFSMDVPLLAYHQ